MHCTRLLYHTTSLKRHATDFSAILNTPAQLSLQNCIVVSESQQLGEGPRVVRQVVEAGVERDHGDAGHGDVDEAPLPRLEQVDGRGELVLAVPKLEALLHGGVGAAAIRHLVAAVEVSGGGLRGKERVRKMGQSSVVKSHEG